MITIAEGRKKVVPGYTKFSIIKQRKVLGINRSGYYDALYQESAKNTHLRKLKDKQYLKRPFYCLQRMNTWLTKDKRYKLRLNQIERLYYKVIGLRSFMPGPHTSKPGRKRTNSIPMLTKGIENWAYKSNMSDEYHLYSNDLQVFLQQYQIT